MMKSEPIAVFYPNVAGSKTYRIPSLITTREGTLLAGIDARIEHIRDNPNQIETALRRSEDNGDTWGPVQRLVSYPGRGLDGAAAIDTALLQDEDTGTIWMLFSHTPGGIGLWLSEPGVGFDREGNRLLFDKENQSYTLMPDGHVYGPDGQRTEYTVDAGGNVYRNGARRGNMYLKQGADPDESLLEARTSFLQLIRSDDDGKTWSKPIELNPAVKLPWMRFIGACPGRGLQLRQGAARGRLLFPIYFSNLHRKKSVAMLYSDDHGHTWHRGLTPNDGRIFNGQPIDAQHVDADGSDLTESQLVELPDGMLRLFMRNTTGKQRTAVAESADGGLTWGEVRFDEALPDPTCQSSAIRYPNRADGGEVLVLFANPADPHRRANGTVRLSEDGGLTWSCSRQVEAGAYAYCCLTVLNDGTVGLLYESDFTKEIPMVIKFTKFSLEWVRSQ